MKITRIPEAAGANPEGVFAMPLLEGEQSNVRIIRLAPGRALPPHRHSVSDLMLFVVTGNGELDQPTGVVPFPAGALAYYAGNEELRVRNAGSVEMAMLAFLAPVEQPWDGPSGPLEAASDAEDLARQED